MSRMVRENPTSGLRERLWFAQWTLRQLKLARTAQRPHGELLAQRSAVILHGYTVLVALARTVSPNAPDGDISLASLLDGAQQSGASQPTLQLLAAAGNDRSDPLCWLQQQAEQLFAAGGLAQRPLAREADSLALTADDPNRPLADGDLQRLEQAVARIERLLSDAATQTEEW